MCITREQPAETGRLAGGNRSGYLLVIGLVTGYELQKSTCNQHLGGGAHLNLKAEFGTELCEPKIETGGSSARSLSRARVH